MPAFWTRVEASKQAILLNYVWLLIVEGRSMSKPDIQFDLRNALNQPLKSDLRDPLARKTLLSISPLKRVTSKLALLEH